jgi:hypothetical protein
MRSFPSQFDHSFSGLAFAVIAPPQDSASALSSLSSTITIVAALLRIFRRLSRVSVAANPLGYGSRRSVVTGHKNRGLRFLPNPQRTSIGLNLLEEQF